MLITFKILWNNLYMAIKILEQFLTSIIEHTLVQTITFSLRWGFHHALQCQGNVRNNLIGSFQSWNIGIQWMQTIFTYTKC